ncbi:MAG: adenylyl-sulfate kinase [Micromonosporaceae bacterium]
MTPVAAGLPADLASWPSWAPGELQLADLELLLAGAFGPLTGFMSAADADTVARHGSLTDGTPFPFPVTLDVPEDALPADAGTLVLTDHEGAPLAVLKVTERTPTGGGEALRVAGPVEALREPEHGPFRRLRRQPSQIRSELSAAGPDPGPGGIPVLACVTRTPLHRRELGQLRHLAGGMKARLLILPLVAGPADLVTRPEALVRAVLAALPHLPPDTLVVPVPLAPRGPEGSRGELLARAIVAASYGATHLFSPGAIQHGLASGTRDIAGVDAVSAALPGSPIPLVAPGEWAFDASAEVWRPAARILPHAKRAAMSPADLIGLLERGDEIPEWFTPAAVSRELRAARRPRHERGLVIFFTGLSGAGKSTVARDVADALIEMGERTVSLLDGDHVRRLLSAGLGFSRADRDLNITRIGYVAAEIARHGGVAICAPIAPYAAARAQVREMVTETGDFVLVHVATPLEACEARDRKGLYAKARSGVISSFTGVSDPYEEPDDADLVIDTSVLGREDAADRVLRMLTSGGWLRPGEVKEP